MRKRQSSCPSAEELLAWCDQKLINHLNRVYEIILDPHSLSGDLGIDTERLEREITVVTNRLSRIGRPSERQRMREYLAVAGYLHDAGKALEVYQQRLKRAEERMKRTGDRVECRVSLAGHELPSAWLAWHLFRNLVSTDVTRVLALGVLLHHSGRRNVYEAYYKLTQQIRMPTKRDVEAMIQLIERAKIDVLGEVDSDRLRSTLHYELNIVYPILKTIDQLVGTPFPQLGELATFVIAVADNLDAYYGRNDKRRSLLVACFLRKSNLD